MVECQYCEQSFPDEAALREHLYKDHEYDDLGRIDTRRVDEYVEDHDLGDGDDGDDSYEQQVSPDSIAEFAGSNHGSGTRWELRDVEELSTAAIMDRLDEHGIDTTEESFRARALEVDAARTIVEQWNDDYDVTASGHDRDFVWMAAEVLWKRWAPDIPNRERIYELVQEGRDLRDRGKDGEACERWLAAWDIVAAVVPEEITTIEAADDHLPNAISLEPFVRSLDSDLASLAADDPAYHERRLEFCRAVCAQFPDAPDELLLDFRHFAAESLVELGRQDEARREFEALIQDYPGDPWAYKKLADSYWRVDPDDLTPSELERGIELYERALDADGPLEGPSIVSERRDDLEQRLVEVDSAERHGT